jgi:hypothetical protein
LTPEIIQELTGLEIEEIEAVQKASNPMETPLNRLKNYYGLEDFKTDCNHGC